MKRRQIAASLLACCIIPLFAASPLSAGPRPPQAAVSTASASVSAISSTLTIPEQIVWLKNGGIVRGAVVEYTPDALITLQLATGEVRTIPWSSVARASWLTPAPIPSAAQSSPAVAPSAPPVELLPVASAKAPQESKTPVPSGSTHIILSADRGGVRLESRAISTADQWQFACEAPCDRSVQTDGRELRINGPGVRPSIAFKTTDRLEHLRLSAHTGSERSYAFGQVGMIGGLSLGFLGGVGFAYGQMDEQQSLKISGIVAMATGAAALLIALPLLASGATKVRDGYGKPVASQGITPWAF